MGIKSLCSFFVLSAVFIAFLSFQGETVEALDCKIGKTIRTGYSDYYTDPSCNNKYSSDYGTVLSFPDEPSGAVACLMLYNPQTAYVKSWGLFCQPYNDDRGGKVWTTNKNVPDGATCARWVSGAGVASCQIETQGVFDKQVNGGECVLPFTCDPVGAVKTSIACENSNSGAQFSRNVCSRTACGTKVSNECDGRAPGYKVEGVGACQKSASDASAGCFWQTKTGITFDSISLSPTSGSAQQGKGVSTIYTAVGSQGNVISFDCPTKPTGVTCTFSGSSCSISSSNTCSGFLSIYTSSLTPAGIHTIIVKGTDTSGKSRTASYSLIVTGTGTASKRFDFSLALDPTSSSVTAGQTVLTTIRVAKTQGDNAEGVLLTCSAPSGVTCSISPTTCKPETACSATMAVRPSAAGTYSVTVRGQAILTTSTQHSVTYTVTATSSSIGSTGGGGSPSSTGRYSFGLEVLPNSIEVLKGRSQGFTVTLTKGDSENRDCDVQLRAYASFKAERLDEVPPKGLTVTLDKSSCSLGPANPTCSVAGRVSAASDTPFSTYDRYYVEGTCHVESDRTRKARLNIKVVPYINDIIVSPASGSVLQGGKTSAIVTVSRSGSSTDSNVPISCLDLPAGTNCAFSGSISSVINDQFGSVRGGDPEQFNWITNALETNAYVTNYGKGGRNDYYLLVAGAPHTEAAVSKSVIIPPLEGRRLFISFDYAVKNSWGPCGFQYRCSWSETNPADLRGVFSISGPNGRHSDTLGYVGGITPLKDNEHCVTGRWSKTCTISYTLTDSVGVVGGVTETRDTDYYFCRWGGCTYTRHEGYGDTGWRTHTAEITSVASNTAKSVLKLEVVNKRWGTRWDYSHLKNHHTLIDNVRIYSDAPFAGCTLSGQSCSVPVTISTDADAPSGTLDISVLGADGYNWFAPFEYGNIYYDWVTGKRQEFADLSKTAKYALNVNFVEQTKVSLSPHLLSAGEETEVEIDFITDKKRYPAGSDVALRLEILHGNDVIDWNSANGCVYGDIRLKVPTAGEMVPDVVEGVLPTKWPTGTVSEAGHFNTKFKCTMPSTIASGVKTLRVTPTVY